MKGKRRLLKGIGVCDRIGVGKAVVIREIKPVYAEKSRRGVKKETKRFELAEEVFTDQLKHLIEYARKDVGDAEADILEGQLILSTDSSISRQVREKIEQGLSAEYAVESVCKKYISSFTDSEDPSLKEKADDIRDIMNGLLVMISGEGSIPMMDIPDGSVIIGRELNPALITSLYNKKIHGIVTESGSGSGHAALIARSLSIPAVFSASGVMRLVVSGQEVIVNGNEGIVYINPSNEDKKINAGKKKELEECLRVLQKYRDIPTKTADGISCRVMCNIGSFEEAEASTSNGCEGIGLFRTELIFQHDFTEPAEDEQYEMYRRVVLSSRGKDVVIRTLDIGGDKMMPFFAMGARGRAALEKNPFLGLRGIRQSLAYRDHFITQIKAILRAAVHGNVSIMLPLVTNIDELRETKRIIIQAAKELEAEEKEYKYGIPLGVMIETPAAVFIAPDIAREVDFLSIGSNDLIQYVMCAERGNPGVEYLSSVFEPAVLRAVHAVIEAAHSQGIKVSMCGEAARDKRLIPLLVAWGLDDYSVNVSSVAAVRREIARYKKDDAIKMAEKVLAMSARQDIEKYLESSVY
ncbi:MAG: phosphoenolpyruvate--protein phosphotransferase [Lachnospiraceae bacterium]|nr:phosphoenolpyruvate--protein phosphotransferase [Lachnospiraceae bacterium]